MFIIFFFDTSFSDIYTLSLHDALPICGLAIDSTVDIFTFYVPHRHVYAEQWIKLMKDGVNPLFTINVTMRDIKIGREAQQECRDRPRIPSSSCIKKSPNRFSRMTTSKHDG